jgi:uncharacterized protein YfdQ (DUF2303 family)
MELNAETILNAGAAVADIKTVEGVPVAVVPEGYTLHQLESLLEQERPRRHRGNLQLLDADSFIRFVAPHVEAGGNVNLLYRIEPSPLFKAVLNAATPAQPAHEDHSASYAAPLSKEWLTWTKNDGEAMGQEKFALFIERNLLDIQNPSGADMLELATSFQAKKGVNFASGTKLANGQTQLVYEETIAAKAGERGQLSVPDEILLRLPVFEGSQIGDELTAKFRYRIDGGKLFMWYELVRPHKVLEVATQDLLRQIEQGTKLKAFKAAL